jgi:hypothetical protein
MMREAQLILVQRRRRELNRALNSAPVEYRADLDYEPSAIMDTIDQMDPYVRGLVNEHGFSPVMKALRETQDLGRVKKTLDERQGHVEMCVSVPH